MARKPQKAKTAQQLCNELYNAVSLPLSDAWVSDDAGEVDAKEYVMFARSHLLALEEARIAFKAFLRKYRRLNQQVGKE